MTANPPFDLAQDYIDEAIEMSEIDLNYRTGEGMRAHDQPAPQVIEPVIEPVKAVQQKRGRVTVRKASIKHGTASAYQRHGCRCEACTTWRRESERSYRERAKAKRAAERSRKRRERDFARWHTRQCRCPECVRVPEEVAG